MTITAKHLSICLMTLLTACATSTYDSTTVPANVEDRVIVDGKVLPLPDEPTITSQPMSGNAQMSSVANRLLVASQSQLQQSDFQAAENSLERALRIEPRNALLWSRLADVKYAQQNWQQAVQLAAKSNTLSANDRELRRRNWYLMVNAYQAMGNTNDAEKYRAKLTQ